jgi:rhamnosyltransferase
MHVTPIVIWYNPKNLGDNVAVQNILSYSKYFEKVIIVDNSNNNNRQLADKIINSYYIPNFENLGIAKALNQGCVAAMATGYTWVMTMDQDSSWETDNLTAYLDTVKSLHETDSHIVSFAPETVSIKNIHSVLGDVKRSVLNTIKKQGSESSCKQNNEYEYVDRVISSGNILELAAWKAAGAFNELLFINDVDYELCYRCKNNGYKIVKILTCKMNHVDGQPQKTFFPHATSYHKERIYYLVRNKFYILAAHPGFAKKYAYKKMVRRIICEKLFFFEFVDLKYVLQGIRDARSNRYGKYGDLGKVT